MDPIAFYIFGISIRWYGIFIALGVISATILAYYTCKFRNLNFDLLLDVVLISLPIGIIGARLYYVIFQFDYYKDNLIDILNIRQGGLAIHGGLIFGLLAAFITAKRKKIDFLSMVDVIAPSVIIAQALGRWGNFFNSEAHGGSVTYGFISHFPKFIQNGMYIEGTYYHPTFLYESIWNIFVSIILITLLRKNNKKGIVFFTYLGLYSLGRFFIEGLRTDSLMIGPIRTAQLMSLCGIIAWIVFLVLLRKRKVKTA